MKRLKIWTCDSTTKIFADKNYPCETADTELVIEAAKGEYESGQIIISAEEDVKSYVVRTFDLVSNDGNVFSAQNVKVYNQKYIKIEHPSKDNNREIHLGLYPDALLPFETAVEYKENHVQAGFNAGIWITFKIPYECIPGEYVGKFEVVCDGESFFVRVKLIVWKFAISREVHAKSDFVIGSNGLKIGEKNYFPEMYRAYVEKLMEFRLAPHRIIQILNLPYVEAKDFVDELRYLTGPGKPDLSTIMLPVYPSDSGINEKDYERFVMALAYACLEDNKNYFEKAAVYCGFIDEPHLNDTWEKTNAVCRQYEILKNKVADKFESEAPDSELKQRVVASMRKVPNYVTTQIDDRLPEVKNWCPHFSAMATAEARERYYKASDSNWWYGCGGSNKAPSFCIDHDLLEPRVVMWMQRDYKLDGQLYWETVQYFKWIWCQQTHINHETEIDCYAEPVRCATDNGDGFLFYPGHPYKIFGPVESIRLHAIRDGMEEYEYLYLFEELCAQKGIDPQPVLREIYDSLYEGVTVKADGKTFMEQRRRLAKLIEELI
jgi:hypothetical protein